MAHASKRNPARYRTLLREAAQESIAVRDGWFFGIPAALILSGSAVGPLMRAWRGISLPENTFLERLFPWSEPLGQWVAQLPLLSSTRATLTLSFVITLGFFLAILAVLCQGALVEMARNRHKKSPRSLLQNSKKIFWRVLGIDALAFATTAALLALLFAPLPAPLSWFDDITQMLFLLVGFALLLVSSAVAIFALADTASGTGVWQSWRTAWRTALAHGLATVELILLLLAASFVIGAIGAVALSFITVLYSTLYLVFAWAGSLVLTSFATTVATLLFVATLLLGAGVFTAFAYHTLTRAYTHIKKRQFESRTRRMVQQMWL
ncbi:hypothetical protein HYW18_02195 [Candidatus Uhrbacteria bacterium]|nr:hypothetical protein [Candidatus Uhrbacteria bacterium]